ncbi:MAG: acetate--CoA ligase [Ignavibacteria bacterium]|nr:acetate--CoA ligase [Ignavibacteria bacterium]MBT8392142.1 acetate--CoA ligase [Ignavibacteria bacterium]NNJ53542.1 acetate--CoA ligase [Ignavibacteriaceae bacterium]NNL21414.1 acetate--CoA ligase [Ignavibacteriaceae bacterium]
MLTNAEYKKGNKNKEELVFKPPPEFKKNAYFSSFSQYKNIYEYSIQNREKFWGSEAKELSWFEKWKVVKQGKAFSSKWFVGSKTNISFNCLDRHVKTDKRNKAALIWESESGESKIITYQLLFTQVCKFANVLKKNGVKKGDYIIIYMGTIPEAIIAMLACTRIGAVHSVVQCELSSKSLSERIDVLKSKIIITQDYIYKKGNKIPIKSKVDAAVKNNDAIEKIILLRRSNSFEIELNSEKEILWNDEIDVTNDKIDAVSLNAQHPVFSMFTNGPKGDLINILHSTGGYMVQSYLSAKWVFDLKNSDILWAAADVGWISGHTYSVYGPLLNGVTIFLYEGVPIYPEPDKYWELIAKYRINILYLNPTTIRALLKLGDEWLFKHDISSLRLLGTRGEPIKPETWKWYFKNVGRSNCPVVDSWLQTETGSILITQLPGPADMKPAITGYPFPGVEIDVVDIKGNSVKIGEGGYLVIKDSWPSMFTTEKEEKAEATLNCWKQFKGNYFTGDAAVKEKSGFMRILGRVDDVIKAAGNRVGGSEIEKILLEHTDVKEAAVVKRLDEIIGNAIVAFVSLAEKKGTPLLKEELRNFVVENIGAIAKPDDLIFIDELPRLKSGKIDRRSLRERAYQGIQQMKGIESEHFKVLERLREEYQSF